MAVDMTPKVGDYSINIPITFDYRGGRAGNIKGKIIISIADVVLTIIMCPWQKLYGMPGSNEPVHSRLIVYSICSEQSLSHGIPHHCKQSC